MSNVNGLNARRLAAQKSLGKAMRGMARAQAVVRQAELRLFAALREREEAAEAIAVATRAAMGQDA